MGGSVALLIDGGIRPIGDSRMGPERLIETTIGYEVAALVVFYAIDF